MWKVGLFVKAKWNVLAITKYFWKGTGLWEWDREVDKEIKIHTAAVKYGCFITSFCFQICNGYDGNWVLDMNDTWAEH